MATISESPKSSALCIELSNVMSTADNSALIAGHHGAAGDAAGAGGLREPELYRTWTIDTITRAQLARIAREPDSLLIDNAPQLKKLGEFSTICLILNRTIGTGIFETPESIWRGTGSTGAALLVWTLGALVSAAGLMVYNELGLTIPRYNVNGDWKTVPRSGGEKNYLEYMFHRPRFLATCLYGTVFIFLGNTAGNAFTTAQYVLQIIAPKFGADEKHAEWVLKGVAVGAITLACLLHGAWRAGGIYVNNVLAMVKLLIVWFFVACAIAAVAGAFPKTDGFVPGLDLQPARSFVQWLPGRTLGVYGWTSALLDVSFSFGGFECAHYVLSEVKDPIRRIPRSTSIALGLVTASYLSANLAYFTVLSAADLGERKTPQRTISIMFFERIFSSSPVVPRALCALVAISAFGNVIVTTFIASKVKQEIAKEGILPFSKFFARDYRSIVEIWRRGDSRAPAAAVSAEQQQQQRIDNVSRGVYEEKTPVPALLLHWATSVLIVCAPPAASVYPIFTRLYAYLTHAWFGVFLAAGLLYHSLYLPSIRPSYRWREIRGFTPPFLPPLYPAFYFCACLFMIIGQWYPPSHHAADVLGDDDVPWFLIGVVSLGLIGVGVAYWAAFRWVVPLFTHEVLRVRRTPFLDRNGAFRFEEVVVQWLDPHAPGVG